MKVTVERSRCATGEEIRRASRLNITFPVTLQLVDGDIFLHWILL